MAIITALTAQKRRETRVNVYLDGTFFCGMELDTVVANGLKVGMAVDENALKNMQFESEKHTAAERSLRYLGVGMKTEKQLRDYLKEKGYTQEVAEYAVSRMKEYRYIDDAAYAREYLQTQSVGKGKKLLRFELLRKGVAAETLEELLAESGGESESCARVAERYLRGKPRDNKLRQKAANYLINKGFGYDTVRETLTNLLCEEGETNDD